MHTSFSFFCALIISVAVGHAADSPAPGFDERLNVLAKENRYRLDYDGEVFSGPAMTILIDEGRAAQFFLLGEEHGIAENPKLAAALFAELSGSGYSKLAIEVSPYMARQLDDAARADGIDGLKSLFKEPGGEPAFFGMKEEAEFLSAARAAVPGKAPVFWGADYEVLGDRQLITRLEEKRNTAIVAEHLSNLRAASDAAWLKYEETKGPQYIYSFSGDPALVRALRDVWTNRDQETSNILDTLEETLEINRLFLSGKNWQSNQRRAALLRANFLEHWNAEKKKRRNPKVFAKFGASHMVRGRSFTETFDLGTLIPELASAQGNKSFSVLVLPGKGAQVAVFDPTTFSFQPATGKDGYSKNIEPIISAAYDDVITLIDMRPLRNISNGTSAVNAPRLQKVIYGFDMVLVMSGSTPSGTLDHESDPESE